MRRISFLIVMMVGSAGGVAAAQDDDVRRGTEAVCCGFECCLIDGQCLADGDLNSRNECEECDPSTSQSEFTPIAGCEPAETDAGGGGGGGGGCSVSAGTAAAVPAFGVAMALVFLAIRRRR
jgi:MYXO-CTERM domain-containing protein